MNGGSMPVFSESDVAFVIETVGPKLNSQRAAMRESYALMEKVLDENNDRMLERALSMEEDAMLLRISPRLLFETFLRKARLALSRRSYMLERVGRQVIPVFDAHDVGDLLFRKGVIPYLANMLVSFTKIESFTLLTGVRDGVWQKMRINTMDIDSLILFCSLVEEEESRFAFYKRIADVCLFIPGIFPESVLSHAPPESGRSRARKGRTVEEYEKEGKEYYDRAATLTAARISDMDAVMRELAVNLRPARKSLNFLADIFLKFRKQRLFALGSSQGQR